MRLQATGLDGAPTNQVVRVQASNFSKEVPVHVVVTRDTDPSLVFDGVIPGGAIPRVASFNVVIPAGTISRIDAWTR